MAGLEPGRGRHGPGRGPSRGQAAPAASRRPSSAAASRVCTPRATSGSTRRCASRSSTGATSTCSSRCSTRSPPARSRPAISPSRCARSCARNRNTTVILGEAVGIDPDERQVLLVGRRPGRLRHAHRRDRAPTTATSTIPEWATLAQGLKTDRGRDRDPAPDPHRLRGRRTGSRSRAAARVDDVRARRRRPDRRRARRGPRRDRPRHAQARFPRDPSRRREDHPRRGDGSRPAGLSARTVRRRRSDSSRRLGVEVRTKTKVIDIDERGVRVSRPTGPSETIPTRTVLWAAGVQASSFARTVAAATGAETDRAGRVLVGPDLTIPGHPEIFVVGDAAVEPWKQGPADAGRRPGRHPGRVVCREGHPPAHPGPTLRAVPLHDHGDVAVIGRLSAVTDIPWLGPVRAAGRLHGLGAVARASTSLPDRLLEPDRRPRPLGVDVPHPRPRHAAHHRPHAAAADRGAGAAGDGAAR